MCEEKDTQYTGFPFSIANDKPCKFFKDKSRFIELTKVDTERHAHWETDKNGWDKCTGCNGHALANLRTTYCPKCGCKIDEVVGNE